MTKSATYYISRITKNEYVDWGQITEAIKTMSVVSSDNYKYTIININEISPGILYGEFAKYEEIGESEIIDEVNKKSRVEQSENKAIAISPFIYWPEEAAICYQHVWNHIREEDFREYFQYLIAQIIAASGFEIIPITDEKEFFKRLIQFKQIYEIDATVTPNNPLFGPIWKELGDYVRRRRAKKLKHKETSEKGSSLSSRIVELAENFQNSDLNLTDVDFGDRAIFMAIDGYGYASIKGFDGNRILVLKTSDKHESFKFNKSPVPVELGNNFINIYNKMKADRKWGHE